jgi:hypothetical protein
MLYLSYFFFESVALLTVLFQFKNLKNSNYKYFLPFLVFIVAYEYGNIRDWFYIRHSNLYITNITEIASFLFYAIFLMYLINNKRYKKVIRTLISLTFLCALLNMAFIQGFWKLDSITIILQFAVIIFIICLYFYELMNSIDINIPIIKIAGFWLNTGLLFFCLAQFLFYSSFAYMAYKGNYYYFQLARVIANIANAILYSCLSVCFLCFSRTKKLS